MDDIVARMQEAGGRRRLLLHACCAPCSSACLELLVQFFDVTVLFYNPNITEAAEYTRRLEEEKRLIAWFNEKVQHTQIAIRDVRYDPETFLAAVKGLEQEPEGGRRCRACFTLRLNEAAAQAAEGGFDCFTTTLTISPLKNADLLNDIGKQAAEVHGVMFLPSDFKKKNGYQRSIELSKECSLYRQDYCGCVFSKAQRRAEAQS